MCPCLFLMQALCIDRCSCSDASASSNWSMYALHIPPANHNLWIKLYTLIVKYFLVQSAWWHAYHSILLCLFFCSIICPRAPACHLHVGSSFFGGVKSKDSLCNIASSVTSLNTMLLCVLDLSWVDGYLWHLPSFFVEHLSS